MTTIHAPEGVNANPDSLINYFDGTEYDWLSNFHPVAIRWVTRNGNIRTAPSSEHVYQAEKMHYRTHYMEVFKAKSPGEAKRLGRQLRMRAGWDAARDDVMMAVVFAKFAQHPKLRKRLLDTDCALLVEGNHWHDNYWGNCLCERCSAIMGANHLGRTLMQVRQQFREVL